MGFDEEVKHSTSAIDNEEVSQTNRDHTTTLLAMTLTPALYTDVRTCEQKQHVLHTALADVVYT